MSELSPNNRRSKENAVKFFYLNKQMDQKFLKIIIESYAKKLLNAKQKVLNERLIEITKEMNSPKMEMKLKKEIQSNITKLSCDDNIDDNGLSLINPQTSHERTINTTDRHSSIRVEYYNDFNACLNFKKSQSTVNSEQKSPKTPIRSDKKNIRYCKVDKIFYENIQRTNQTSDVKLKRIKMTVNEDEKQNKDSEYRNKKIINIKRDLSQTFGLSIVGGKVNVSENKWISGIFIKDIIPNSPADLVKELKVGDRILQIGDTDLSNSTHYQAINLIKQLGKSLSIVVESFEEKYEKFEYHQSNENITINDDFVKFDKKVQPPPVTPTKSPNPIIIQDNKEIDKEENKENIHIENKVNEIKSQENEVILSDDEDNDDEEDTVTNIDMSGHTVTAAGVEIDRASAGNVQRSKDEISLDKEKEDEFGYTSDKIKKKYGSLGFVFKCRVERNSSSYIGLSLAGHKDRNKMACFVVGINPKRATALSQITIGDEILEVNGIVLHGRCHLNASAIIKELPGSEITFIVLRRKSASDDLAVKPVKQFPLYLLNQNDEAFSNFKNVKSIKIKKGPLGLGIMIIEGRHSEAGQGIFISDIQEGSNAERAGLAIGDMILAVNNETLLGCNYESAATLLKRTEGLLTLKICSPSREKENDKTNNENVNSSNKKVEIKSQKDKLDTKKSTVHDSTSHAKEPHVPVKEPHVNLHTCPIIPNKPSEMEIITNGKSLGIRVVGGCDSHVPNGTVIVQIYPGNAAETDKRLKVFDQILEINGVKLNQSISNEQIEKNIKQLAAKIKMLIYRAEPDELNDVTVELIKKPGKSIGIEMLEILPFGVIITSLLAGSTAAIDNRLRVGDIITHVNNEDIRKLKADECITVLRAMQGCVSLRVIRPSPKIR